MQQHFSEDVTENITLDGHEVLMCNIPFSQAFIDSKYFNGYGVDVMGHNFMNIAFMDVKMPVLNRGDIVNWQYYDDVYEVQVIDVYKLFVKGLNIQYYLVQLKQAFLE
ncbi:hypothetical protein N4Q63_16035 [Leclercia adecarboxylata]|uniref:Uncharacterized protein n=1 Tax=Leclercia adecarboxylata TaxID=83655 RepID=A0A9X3YC72_9ENTR|nr:hypothetical protein [Leclercia adecarboxylata]MBD1404673.1 hypothetical protein [Leclercia adecarboxylata]MDC6623339.1 hypothetical protein [Leclercia adecarboxylata]MDC6634427.1 hypothetical protein [Leclercia adecarboxylata]MDC6639541.1 hypothetical protein [Leclercia adecarboxylata]MDC6650409.1 hypothetical protein [Leclercia adecarboxylata]